ncbi:ubiquitin-conjugating enzyme E2 W, variant [Capsaspora owczarzaki ATCC 30864]|uniref:Ubiquitin-conjugating enzyme E2 W, variant n=1 Tax=Capsaspora owczarzaki (strain ATCC 30864) TaxID=595528 RepID=A0A0D2VG63_CAPO3|nr:ubiquitin-conjugating enzyme E2 W, variant [Capsaspora owczarzaki ATCC 30864]
MAGRFTRRLQKELLDLQRSPPTGVKLEDNTTRLDQWRIHLTGADGSLYAGEHFVLRFRFGNNYPMEAPEVVFEGPNIPMHGHIYSNGHICVRDFCFAQLVKLHRFFDLLL